jgi:hypothetical protein
VCFAWITEAKYTRSYYVILLAFTRQQWLRERAFVLRCTYIACLVILVLWVCINHISDAETAVFAKGGGGGVFQKVPSYWSLPVTELACSRGDRVYQDSSVDIVTRLRAWRQRTRSNPGRGKTFLLSSNRPGSYSVGTGDFPGLKRRARKADHSPRSSSEVTRCLIEQNRFTFFVFA